VGSLRLERVSEDGGRTWVETLYFPAIGATARGQSVRPVPLRAGAAGVSTRAASSVTLSLRRSGRAAFRATYRRSAFWPGSALHMIGV
jgi:hypothetical protein